MQAVEDRQAQGLKSDPAKKAIADLDELIQAVSAALPSAKPWQRQLRLYLEGADRQIQVLRMTISLGRPKVEVCEARDSLLQSVRAAHAYVNGGRADMGTRTAVLLALELARKVALVLDENE